jgi:Protein of unknown function (DUF3383)
MAISFKRYVDITSGVGGGAGVRMRDLILRLFTTSPRVPAGSVVEMTSADDAKTYFGTGSAEYLRALFYFGFISKLITSPKKISFSRWADVASAARIYGASRTYLVGSFTAITTGSLRLTLGAYSADVTGLNFTSATTLSNIAAVLQTAIRAITAGGADWTGATVTYNATANRFELVGGAVGAAPIAVTAASSGVPVAALLGWDASGVFSPGVAAQEPVDAFATSVGLSDNFGTFAFIPALTDVQVAAVAAQNDTYNVKFIYSVPVTVSTAAAYYAALQGFSGVAATLAPLATEFPELAPAAVLAATDYSRRNSVQNYMFQQFALTPSVLDDTTATTLDNARTNYYGRTQTAGQFIDFYQRGVMMGLATDPVDLNVYANEMWFKDAAGAQIMRLLLSSSRVPANASGRAALTSTLGSVIEQAVFNGTISVGKPLSQVQKLYITNMTGDPLAWQQVARLGYWLDVTLQSYVTQDSRTEWKAVYTLIYSKDDAIRKVEGSHVLI